MNKVTDAEYLQKEMIPNLVYAITNDMINVHSDSTSFCNVRRNVKLVQKDLLEKYAQVYRLAREQKVTIHYTNKYKKFIQENWSEYVAEFEFYDKLFDELIPSWQRVQQRGIHMGCSDDAVLKRVEGLTNKYSECYYRNTWSSKMNHINNELDKLLSTFTLVSDTYSVITIHL